MFQKRLGAVMPGSNTYLILRKHFRNIMRMNVIDRKTDYSVMIIRILTPQYTDMLCFTKRLHRLCRKSPVSLLNIFVSYAVYVPYCLGKCICSGSISIFSRISMTGESASKTEATSSAKDFRLNVPKIRSTNG